MTKREHLIELREKADKASAFQSKQGTLRRYIVLAVLCLGTVSVCLAGLGRTKALQEEQVREVLADPTRASLETIQYGDTFSVWNETVNGADLNTLLGGGMLYSRDGVRVLPNETMDAYIVTRDGAELGRIKDRISYINVWKETVIYRSEKTHQIRAFDWKKKKTVTLIDENVGEVFVSGDQIYYTDLAKNSRLFAAGLDGKNPSAVIDVPVSEFAVLGDSILYLGYDHVFSRYLRSSGSTEALDHGIERFYYCDGWVMEAGDTIYRTEADGTKPETLYTSRDEGMRLVGAANGFVFFEEAGRLKTFLGGEPFDLLSKEFQEHRSVLIENGNLYVLALSDEPSAAAVWKLMKTAFVL